VGYPASEHLPARPAHYDRHEANSDSNVALKLLALFLGLAVGVLFPVAIWLAASSQDARNDAKAAAAKAGATSSVAMPGMPGMTAGDMPGASEGVYATPSFAGIGAADADAIAKQHAAVPAALPAALAGPVAHVNLAVNHQTVSIAPGIRYEAWTFGKAGPGPVIHVREGQVVKVRLTNSSPMPHSVDFHAAQIAPNVAFADIAPGKSKFSFVASTPGVFMYHCGTSPAFMHIANGMYGAIAVEPKNKPPAHKQYVLVSSEWYLNAPGDKTPAGLDLTKANNMTPDWVTWNGYAHQYKEHPLTAMPGDTVRFWVVDAGPSLNTEFHVVGTILSRAWIDAGLRDAPQHDVQTAIVPAGGGGVFDVRIDKPGIYPFVSHSFASVNLGEVGLLNVGHVAGTMSH
jgi:copper-containing nitrite reductase